MIFCQPQNKLIDFDYPRSSGKLFLFTPVSSPRCLFSLFVFFPSLASRVFFSSFHCLVVIFRQTFFAPASLNFLVLLFPFLFHPSHVFPLTGRLDIAFNFLQFTIIIAGRRKSQQAAKEVPFAGAAQNHQKRTRAGKRRQRSRGREIQEES